MKFIFIVQGEGRGHMTQAISLFQLLTASGHEVPHVLIGKSNRRCLPDFIKRNLHTSISQFESPNFHTDKNEKSINIFKTIFCNLLKAGSFYKSFRAIDEVVKKHQPDIILNFYDNLAGLYNFFYQPSSSFWVIGHQYLIYHPEFPFAPNNSLQKLLFKINTWITALGAEKLLALSFRELPNYTHKKLKIIPPLLRPQVKQMTPKHGEFILTYIVNSGYSDEIIAFGIKHPNVKIEVFWDKKDAPESYRPLPNITFHQINDQLFLQKMASCRGLVCTAGFESVCEAMYFGKWVMMIPVQGQYEQACNALDGLISNAGLSHTSFDFESFDQFLQNAPRKDDSFQKWQDKLPAKISQIILESRKGNSYNFLLNTEAYS